MGTKRDAKSDSTHEKPIATPVGKMDELDLAILHYLEQAGRATNYEVGEAVGLSASASSRRIQSLEEMGAIRGYRALIDDRLLGRQMTVFVRVTLEKQSAPVLAAFEAQKTAFNQHRRLPRFAQELKAGPLHPPVLQPQAAGHALLQLEGQKHVALVLFVARLAGLSRLAPALIAGSQPGRSQTKNFQAAHPRLPRVVMEADK